MYISFPKDGSPAKKFAESKPEEQPAAVEAMEVVSDQKEDPVAAQEDNKPSEPAAIESADKTVETAADCAAAETVATQ